MPLISAIPVGTIRLNLSTRRDKPPSISTFQQFAMLKVPKFAFPLKTRAPELLAECQFLGGAYGSVREQLVPLFRLMSAFWDLC